MTTPGSRPAGRPEEEEEEATPAATPVPRRRRSIPRRHVVLLSLIAAVGLVRGLFWVSITLVFNPIDEAPHFAYVESMARHLRPPVVGRDRLSPEAMQLLKGTATSYWRPVPLPPDPADRRWLAVAQSYEGVQGPAYYALAALPYRVGHLFGELAGLYAVRTTSVLLSLLGVPIAYLLARELFPERREVWLAAPALLVVLQGFNANLASVTNDALVVPVAGAVLVAAARLRDRGFTGWGGAVTGALLGLGLATKSNMIALFPLVGVWALGVARARRVPWATVLRWGAAAGCAAMVVAGPWLAWNLAQYGALSADRQVDRITGPLQPDIPRTFAGLRRHLHDATTGFWDSQLAGRPAGRYMWVLSLAGAALVLGAGAISLVRRRRRDLAALSWLGSAVFVTVGAMLFVIFVVFSGRSSVVGRHLYPALVATVVVVAAAAFMVAGRRGGWVVVLVLGALTTTFEIDTVHRHLAQVYTSGVIGRLAPVVEQTWATGLVDTPSVRMTPGCPAQVFALGLETPAPASLSVTTAAGAVTARRTGEQTDQAEPLTTYALSSPASGFDVALPGVPLLASADDRDPHLSLQGEPGDPVARVFCPRAHAVAFRFHQRFDPDHPAWIGYRGARLWPVLWAWAARAALAATALAFARARWADRRSEMSPGEAGRSG